MSPNQHDFSPADTFDDRRLVEHNKFFCAIITCVNHRCLGSSYCIIEQIRIPTNKSQRTWVLREKVGNIVNLNKTLQDRAGGCKYAAYTQTLLSMTIQQSSPELCFLTSSGVYLVREDMEFFLVCSGATVVVGGQEVGELAGCLK